MKCDIEGCPNRAAFRVLGERKPAPAIQHRVCAAHHDGVVDQYRGQLYAVTVIELPKGAGMERHVTNRPAMACPKVDAFLAEIEHICTKHGMALMPMVEFSAATGSFRVIKVKGPSDWKTRESGEKLVNASVDGETFEKDDDL